MRSARQKLREQRALAQKWEREHRQMWVESPSGFVSLDDIDIQAELGVAECSPEYLLMVEQEPSLEDWLVGVDYDPAATESQSAVSSFLSFFNQK